jgi:hypothetical protein
MTGSASGGSPAAARITTRVVEWDDAADAYLDDSVKLVVTR